MRQRSKTEDGESRAPFEIKVWDVQLLVKRFKAGVEDLVLFLLPVGAGGVAEEDAAAKGTDGVDGAEFVELEGASAGSGWGGGSIGGWEAAEGVEERCEVEGGDVEVVAEIVEVAAAAAEDAEGAASIDLFLDVLIKIGDGGADVGARGGGENCLAGLVELAFS